MPGQEFYSEDEVEQILRLASHSMPAGGVDRDRLLSMAAEIGISQDAVLAAAQQVKVQNTEIQERREFDRHIRRDFVSHLTSYVLINGLLLAINLLTSPESLWFYWPMLGWGIGLLFHVAGTFFRNSEDYQHEFEKWRDKRRLAAAGPAPLPAAADLDAVLERWVAVTTHIDKLQAIKYVREQTGMGLKDAKDCVDRFFARHGLG